MKRSSAFAAAAQRTGQKHQAIQREVSRADKNKKKQAEKPMQAACRKYQSLAAIREGRSV